MKAKDKAREIVNKIYQPLGYLSCNVSNNKMWEYAKERAIEFLDEIIATTSDGTEDYWHEVKEAVTKL